MKILLYGIPAAVAAHVAARYGLRLAASFDEECERECDDREDAPTGILLPVEPVRSPDGLLMLYNAMLAHEADIAAVVVCKAGDCDTCNTIQYGAPPGKFYTLGCDADEEALAYELGRILETRLGRICAHEGI